LYDRVTAKHHNKNDHNTTTHLLQMGHPIDHYSKIKKELVPSDDPEVREEISETRKPCQPEDQQVVRDLRQLGKRVLLVDAAIRHIVDEDDVEGGP
jgi:hypothetical protein